MRPYHPNYFNPDDQDVGRPHCRKRLALLLPYVHVQGTVLDIGCNKGFFSFGVAETGASVLGIDRKRSNISSCRKRQKGRFDNLKFQVCDLHNFVMQPYDTILYLSVHHHVIGKDGDDVAAGTLRNIMSHTKKNMLFDIGQKNERHGYNSWWGAIPEGEPDLWIEGLLREAGAKEVEKLGAFESHGALRGLWRASR